MNKTLANLSIKAESRLDKELAFLFGKRVVAQSMQLNAEDMALEAEPVAEGARQLLEHQGHPEAQRMIIGCMDELTTMALCKWIRVPLSMSHIVRFIH